MTTFTTQDRQDAQRTPLTQVKVMEIMKNILWDIEDFDMSQVMLFVNAIERAHGIGESND
jgi:hypothetical protein